MNEQMCRAGPSEDTPLVEQEASSAHSIALIIRSEFRFKPPADLDVDAVAAILAIGMPHTAPLAAWCHEARKRIDPALAPYIRRSWWERMRRWLRRHGI